MLRVVTDESTREELSSTLDEICREGARRMLAAALELEADEYLAALGGRARRAGPAAGGPQRARPAAHDHDGGGRGRGAGASGERPARRSRHRGAQCGSRARSCRRGAARAPRCPRCCRCCTCTACRRGDFAPALTEFFGLGGVVAVGDHPAHHPVAGRAAGLHGPGSVGPGLRVLLGRRGALQRAPGGGPAVLPGHRGVRLDGTKELVAIADGYRESTDVVGRPAA